jgi:hypothetical protein
MLIWSWSVFGSAATATFTDKKGTQHVLKMKGSIFDTRAEIIDEARNGMLLLPHLLVT